MAGTLPCRNAEFAPKPLSPDKEMFALCNQIERRPSPGKLYPEAYFGACIVLVFSIQTFSHSNNE